MALKQVWIIPFVTFLFIPCSFLVTYGIGVALGHFNAFFPFISDTGALAPESYFFGQFLNIGAVLMAICVYLRHRQIVAFYGHNLKRSGRWRMMSTFALWIGLVASLGASVVANFQESSSPWILAHYIGALMAFGLGIVYGWIQTIYTYYMRPRMTGLFIVHSRLALVILATTFFASMETAGRIAVHMNANVTAVLEFHGWTPDTPGYAEHIVCTFSEWLLVICFQLYLLSFAYELRHAQLLPMKLVLSGKLLNIANKHSPPNAKTALEERFSAAGTLPVTEAGSYRAVLEEGESFHVNPS